MKAKQIMSLEPTIARPDDSLYILLKTFMKSRHHSIYIIDDNDNLVGVVSESDILGMIVPKFASIDLSLTHMMAEGFFEKKCRELKDIAIEDIMQKDLITVDEESPMIEVTSKIVFRKVYSIPIVRNKKLLGVVYREELFNHLAKTILDY